MYANQFAYDMAEPDIDPLQEAEERIGDLLDDGDQATAEAFAGYAYGRISRAEIIDAMAALFRVTDSKWRHLRDKLCEDVVSGPLDCLRICMDEYRADFIAERACHIQEDSE